MIDKFPPFIGGAELQARLLARLLSAQIGPTHVYTSQPDARSEAPSIVVHRLGGSRRHALRHPGNFAAAFGHFLAMGGRESIVHGYALSGLTCGAILGARLRGRATLIKVCSSGPEGDVAKLRRHALGRALWPIIRRGCPFVVPSPAVIPDLVAHGVGADAVTVIPNALAPDAPAPPASPALQMSIDAPRTPTSAPQTPAVASKAVERAALGLPDRATVLFVGRLSEEKGPDLLMRAWERIAAECDATLVVVGAGAESERLARWATTTAHPGRVRLVGTRLDVDRFYRAADVMLVPSRSETFGNVTAEAMAHGLAVVTTPVGLATHWIRHGHSALVVDADAHAMAAAVVRLVRDTALRADLGRAARAEALGSFSAAAIVERHVELYQRLVAASPVPVAA